MCACDKMLGIHTNALAVFTNRRIIEMRGKVVLRVWNRRKSEGIFNRRPPPPSKAMAEVTIRPAEGAPIAPITRLENSEKVLTSTVSRTPASSRLSSRALCLSWSSYFFFLTRVKSRVSVASANRSSKALSPPRKEQHLETLGNERVHLPAGKKMQEATSKNTKQSKMEAAPRNWQPKPILGSEFTEDPPLREVYVGIIKDKKHISIAIPSISTILPGFNHLKRCSSNRLLLAPLESSEQSTELESSNKNNILSRDKLKSILLEKGFNLSILEDDFQIVKVPGRAPKTKEQAARASKIWPVNFHPDPNIEHLISGLIFDDHLLDLIENYMKVVIEAAKLEAIGNLDCNGSAVVVDPEDGRILAVSASRINEHPMWHAAMLAIDLVAKLQGGGAWKLEKNNKPNETKAQLTSPQDNENSTEKNTEKNKKCTKRIHEEEAPLHYPKSLQKIPLPVAESLRAKNVQKGGRHNSSGKTKNVNESDKISNEASGEKSGPYLCTGYWVFLLEEPCPLCAMALLHSRASSIFYGVPNERTGILGSKAILHSVPGLNHRYKVWSSVFEEECQKVWQEVKQRIAT